MFQTISMHSLPCNKELIIAYYLILFVMINYRNIPEYILFVLMLLWVLAPCQMVDDHLQQTGCYLEVPVVSKLYRF